MLWPKIIQGGMGAGVSSRRLARAVSSAGQLGVVSGIALDTLLVRRLQDGDPDGSVRRALGHFPIRSIAERILDRYFLPGGRRPGQPYAAAPMPSAAAARAWIELCIAGNFVEIFLARDGHDNPVGINYLEKIQVPHLPSIYGALLAGVAVVIMGAGIPTRIPGVLDRLAIHQPASYELSVAGDGENETMTFAPREILDADLPPLTRPHFLAIISSNALATTMLKRSNGRVDGFVIEGPTAGGHNSPPRGVRQLDASGQPVYGDKDAVDLGRIREFGLPFWLAGGEASPDRLAAALEAGAAGVQIGTAFALCEESGLDPALRHALLRNVLDGRASVFTDPLASPTGFPFKVAALEGSLSEPGVYEARERICDLGYLREAYRRENGTIGYRCPGEPVASYVAKGGDTADSLGRKCLCNALVANIGMAQVRDNGLEPPLVTAGDDLSGVRRFLQPGQTSYTARDVIDTMLAGDRTGAC